MADEEEEATFTQARHAVPEPWRKQENGSESGLCWWVALDKRFL